MTTREPKTAILDKTERPFSNMNHLSTPLADCYLKVDDRLLEIIDPSAKLDRIASGFGFTEGPIWLEQSATLVFSDVEGSAQYSWSEQDGVSLFRKPSNFANGNALDRQGRIVTCEHGTSSVVRLEHDDRIVRTLVSHYDGKELNSPNDIVVDSKDRIWFTDPTFGRIMASIGPVRPLHLGFQGVYRLDPDGSLHLVMADFDQPNGLCFTRDEGQLLVNDTRRGVIRIFDVTGEGKLVNDRIFADVRGTGEGNPDGMKVDDAGNVYCNGPGGVHVFDPSGIHLGAILTPEKSANFVFGGNDGQTLFIAASTSIYAVRLKASGGGQVSKTERC